VLLTRPTVSGDIKILETELGLRLFDRAGKTVKPARAGEILCLYARRILALREETQEALNEHKGGLKGHLATGGSNTCSPLSNAFRSFLEQSAQSGA